VVKTGADVHYISPDGKQEVVANSALASGNLMETWQASEQNARQGPDYWKIRLTEATFRGWPAVVWEYTFTITGTHWHALLVGFIAYGKSYRSISPTSRPRRSRLTAWSRTASPCCERPKCVLATS
jgi:hypothetical protein